VKFSHDRKVRSFAKKTLGSTRVGSAIRLPVIAMLAWTLHALSGLLGGKNSAYQELTEVEVGSTSCGGLMRLAEKDRVVLKPGDAIG
jgi:hypothetical protein